MPKRKNFFPFILKFIFSLSIIVFILVKKTTVSDIGASIKGASLFWICLSFSLHSLGLLISAYRWQILIHAHGDHVPLGFLAKSYLVGNFFNLFLPTRFGGDIVRIWDGSRYSKSVLKSTAIVFMERLSGIIVLLFFALGVSLFRLDLAQRLPVIWISLGVGFFGLLAILCFFLPFSKTLIDLIPQSGISGKIKLKIIEFREIVFIYKEKKEAFLKALFWAFLLQINVILHYYFVGRALHLDIPLVDYFIFIPIVLIILTIPITINGLGLRETLYMKIFASYGIPNSSAVSFSLIADIVFAVIIGVLGGIIYAFRKQNK
ncbi:MAG: flippase-like domain-containing protein [Candidatus Aminicenantes bacterium]|nr:flippase-like domain-containing protein [Candidatus Aminicenantes bacterium]